MFSVPRPGHKGVVLLKIMRRPGRRRMKISFPLRLLSSHPETRDLPSPSGWGRVRVGVITIGISRLFISIPPHPAPLPRGEREFPDEDYLAKSEGGQEPFSL